MATQQTIFEEQKVQPDIILLDYVITLVANYFDRPRGRVVGGYEKWIEQETYRTWLVELLKEFQATGGTVILITARSDKYQEATLARLAKICPLDFDACYFNELQVAPPKSKRHCLNQYIYGTFGKVNEVNYLALESNRSTRAMYAREGIAALPVPIKGEWDTLPEITPHGERQRQQRS